MRELDVSRITEKISEMCIEANIFLESDVKEKIESSHLHESSEVGRSVLAQLKENMEIAENERIPVCQDTGMTVVFLEIGQDVHFVGGDINEAVNEGVRRGYEEGYLRKSVVRDPIERENTGDNTPAIIHYEIVPGDRVEITLAPKGFGSENMSRIFMLKPADGLEGVKNAVIETARAAGPNACPPFFIGVGIGGDFEKCAVLAKKALTKAVSDDKSKADRPSYADALEKELLDEINKSGLGPAGLGGDVTALGVSVETYPTHIAGLPVAVCMCCHVNRHKHRII